MPIFAGEPVVTSTNHGSARNVICEPSARDDLGGEQREQRPVAEDHAAAAPALRDAASHAATRAATPIHRDRSARPRSRRAPARAERREHRPDDEQARAACRAPDRHVRGHRLRRGSRAASAASRSSGSSGCRCRSRRPLAKSAATSDRRGDVQRQDPERQRLERHGQRDEPQPVEPPREERGTRGCCRRRRRRRSRRSSMPATVGSAPKRSTTRTGTAAKNACHAASPTMKSGIQTRSSGSCTRKRRPASRPRVLLGRRRRPGRGTNDEQTSTNETTYVAASTTSTLGAPRRRSARRRAAARAAS